MKVERPSSLTATRYFVVFLDLEVFLDFSKSSLLGAPWSEGLRMCSLLPRAMRSCFAWILAYRPVLAVVILRPSSRFVHLYFALSLEVPLAK